MNELPIDWKQERPNSAELAELWTSIQLRPLDNWTLSTTTLKEKIAETHCNGGIQLHKYKIAGNRHFDWFVQRNRLDEIDFLKNIFRHKNLENYRTDLAIRENSPEVIHVKYWTDIYDLTGQLSRIMGLGGSYKNIDQKEAWTTASDFVKDEFENRFEEFNLYKFVIETSQWFHDIAWDHSFLLFDKRKYEIIIIDITDTD
ncbi:hypothetical protein I6I99_19105 [Sphingobacterium multivorum]|uniref:Uncharacterized protein n=1 Tax=Sphingobacterium multivorum TaxID=28454 RepID=A0ABX7CR15_SPHMU|nr:hypothetical protein [Sphingobacterium multivorum]QQT29439.1 hypothetical protein I6I99_19105 [Sphingobacterium multivorum]QQT54541.1 hypothetical protein I6I98_04600 [Sphingobacterium multivorum]